MHASGTFEVTEFLVPILNPTFSLNKTFSMKGGKWGGVDGRDFSARLRFGLHKFVVNTIT